MASRILLHRIHVPSTLCRRQITHNILRTYATSNNNPRPTQNTSGLLDQAFAQRSQSARDEYRDSVGPIPLGMIRPSIRYDEKVKKWSELSTAGKVGRATARTGNLTVILLGAGLTAMLVYALTSELFSQNSPTVVYNRACDKITASPRIAAHLPGPLKFHNHPPSSLRPRHRNPHVSSQIMVDSTGREHMFLTFFVSSSPSTSSSSTISDRVEQAWEKVSEMSFDQAIVAAKDKVEGWGEGALTAVRYLVGKPVPTVPVANGSREKEVEKEEKKGAWSFVGLFSSLHSSRGEDGSVPGSKGQFTEGEVHAELIRNDDGYFAFRYLLVDVPSSKTWNRTRIFVERAPGVSEREPVMSTS